MTNLETLKQFNEIIKPYLEENPTIDFTDIMFWADSYSREMNGVPLLMKSNAMFIQTLEKNKQS